MITRLYVNNYKVLNSFTLEAKPIVILMGRNGAGKTTVLDVLRSLRNFMTGRLDVVAAFPAATLSRLNLSPELYQTFELDVQIADDLFTYRLVIEHEDDLRRRRVSEESLHLGAQPLYTFAQTRGQLYRDDGSSGPAIRPDWTRSALPGIPALPENKLLTAFRETIGRILVCKPVPENIKAISEDEVEEPRYDLADFASWYRSLTQSRINEIMELHHELRAGPLPPLKQLSLSPGKVKSLEVKLAANGGGKSYHELSFDELSDGERMLIILYSLLHVWFEQGSILCVDEPDNHLALREVQPWLNSLQDQVEKFSGQAFLVSHHPEVIDLLGIECGVLLYRDHGGVTRTRAVLADDSGLRLSELLALGQADA
jgi:predicted ATPase